MINKEAAGAACYEAFHGQPHSNTAALQSGPLREVVNISKDTVVALIIGIPTLMIAFAMLVLKIVEVSRSK